MANWNEIKMSIGNFAGKTAAKTRDLADTASLKIKIANKEAERDVQYKALGKLSYAKLRELQVNDPEAITKGISDTLDKLDSIHKELCELRAAEQAIRDANQAEKEARKQAKMREQELEEQENEQLNRKVMEEFNNARQKADVEFEKAKAEADELK